ncbi:hypothetical protein YOLOSWAG_23 [Erwinia phage vB_EamM_Yoloswag]|uniref:Uncharacterized protein n=1 Tax=Erwinia phage vB_EamM_Yoloswag TaxID=1958956 RepID=A0A1S6L2V7_9CAUD|nr:hypothetical protein HOR66_gp023 [Erwinia phage vB_EamM_Yoloswag]AQT28510.1 hypothetical protein YOLOSWAG_23 [Erwinia phage vB_EamM_Yoloswag]
MPTVKVSKDQCPGFIDGSIAYWERSEDPFHKKAYPKQIRHLAPIQEGRRRAGWMAIDGHENPVGFVADGQEVEADSTEWITYIGPFDRPVCVPLAQHSIKTIEQHCKMRTERQRKNLKTVERTTGIVEQAKAVVRRIICK